MPTEIPPLYTDRMRHAVTWALLRHVWQSFDSGGESNRSARSRALETVMAAIRPLVPERALHAVIRAADADFAEFQRLATQCQSHDDLQARLDEDRRAGIHPLPGIDRILAGGEATQTEMAALLRRHGWPDEDDTAWLIYYEDADVRPEVFAGFGAETGAKRRFRQVTIGYNAHLFCRVASA